MQELLHFVPLNAGIPNSFPVRPPMETGKSENLEKVSSCNPTESASGTSSLEVPFARDQERRDRTDRI